MSVFNPLQQVANIISIAAAGFLAGTVLQGMHLTVAGVRFGAVDSIFAVSALLIIAGGLALMAQLPKAIAAEAGDAASLSARQGGSAELARTSRDQG